MENIVNINTIDLSAKEFNDVLNFNFIIIENKEIKLGDYILFRQCEKDSENNIVSYTGQNQIMCVKSINNSNNGLKENYVVMMLNKI